VQAERGVDADHPARRFAGLSLQTRWSHGVQQRQRQRNAGAAEKDAPADKPENARPEKLEKR